MTYQGIGQSNMLKHRVSAGGASSNAEDEAVVNVHENRFCIPLDFEVLETHRSFYQACLGDRMEYELTFDDYMKVVLCCVVALRPRSTAKVMLGRSVNLTTFFLSRLTPIKRLTSTQCTFFRK